VKQKYLLIILNNAPLILFGLVFAVLGLMSGKFLEWQNLVNIGVQSSSIAIVATGMTFVLLTAGVDLSVGSVMFVAVALAGKMIFGGQPIWLAFLTAVLIGGLAGAINAFFVTRLKIVAFIVTLSMLFAARGFGLWITQTRAMNMPDGVTSIGTGSFLGIPLPILILIVVCFGAHILLMHTPFGRQIYAVGRDADGARKAGLNVSFILFSVYVICGICAAISGLVALTQTGAVSPSFGDKKEFVAIAAAVLGGTSLFGGRGKVVPGTLLGAVLIQTVENGLVILNANPYIYPIVTSLIILLAVLLDSVRTRILEKIHRRPIRVEELEVAILSR
jgi:ribose transport system permease protein